MVTKISFVLAAPPQELTHYALFPSTGDFLTTLGLANKNAHLSVAFGAGTLRAVANVLFLLTIMVVSSGVLDSIDGA
jgi:hypothetical protein